MKNIQRKFSFWNISFWNYFRFGFLFLLSSSFGSWVRKIHPKKPPKDKLITPMNVISNEESDENPGATVRPIIIPKIPVPKNIIIRTFSLNGLMYFIYRLCTKNRHYKWNDKSGGSLNQLWKRVKIRLQVTF